MIERMGTQDARRRKQELLARSIAKGDMVTASRLLGVSGRSRPKPRLPEPLSLAKACRGSEAAVQTPAGPRVCYRIRRTLREVSPEGGGIAREYSAVLRGARQRFDDDTALGASAGLCHAADGGPEDLLFVDVETAQRGGGGVWLLGTMRYVGEQFLFEQHLARDDCEEPALLSAFADRYGEARVLVTFRGRPSAMKVLRERSAAHDIVLPRRGASHLDLRREARRRWREDVPNVRLETLEFALCGRRRPGRVARAEIPAAYRHFRATGDARRIGEILHHSRLDLLTMAQLVVAVLAGCGPAVE